MTDYDVSGIRLYTDETYIYVEVKVNNVSVPVIRELKSNVRDGSLDHFVSSAEMERLYTVTKDE